MYFCPVCMDSNTDGSLDVPNSPITLNLPKHRTGSVVMGSQEQRSGLHNACHFRFITRPRYEKVVFVVFIFNDALRVDLQVIHLYSCKSRKISAY